MLSPSGREVAITTISEKEEGWCRKWEVHRNSPVFVDDTRKLIYFEGTRDTPLETHFYVASYLWLFLYFLLAAF